MRYEKCVQFGCSLIGGRDVAARFLESSTEVSRPSDKPVFILFEYLLKIEVLDRIDYGEVLVYLVLSRKELH